MAITNAQQYQQLVNPPMKGNKRPGYRGDAAYGKDSRSEQATSIGQAQGKKGTPSPGGNQLGDGPAPGADKSRDYVQYDPDAALAAAVKAANEKPKGILNQIPSGINLTKNFINNIPFIKNQLEKNRIDFIKDQYPEYYDEEEGLVGLPANLQDLYDKGKLSSQEAQDVLMNMTSGDMNFPDYMATVKGSPALKYSGNVGNLEKYVTKRDAEGRPLEYGYKEKMGDGDGAMSDYERRLLALEQSMSPTTEPEVKEEEDDEIINYRLMAGGGMADETVGGIMDLESARQMYGLGKLVKKVTRSVKKIAKSPIGKAAILAAGGYALGGGFGTAAGGFKKATLLSRLGLGGFENVGANRIFQKNALGKFLTNKATLGIGIPAIASYFMTPEEEEEQKLLAKGADIDDVDTIINNPRDYINPRLMAEGGSTEEKEPVAKKVMPLLDMDGKEKDYRETGGFVDMGRMEKAYDVPARLSKNEFVFTADAVRNAGDGSVDKGAEVMYNMMKNLESGGDVSEESQGLEGARKMFQTSQRLEEVL